MREVDYTELIGADIQIGAVEIKDSDTDTRANVVPTPLGNALVVTTTPIIPSTPTILNITVDPSTWIQITIPTTVVTWLIKPREVMEYRLSFDGINYLTINYGMMIYSSDSRPETIYVYHTEPSPKVFEILYWEA
jgi:hypothetical protein